MSAAPSRIRGVLLRGAALLAAWHVLMFYGLPLPVLLAIWLLVLTPVVVYARPGNAWLLVAALAIVTLMLEVAFKVTGFGTAMFYRPTEMLRVGSNEFGRVYRSNVHLTMHSPFGDLQATRQVGIIEPREIDFITDNLGFRNRGDYHGQKLFLVGDSFGMGEGETQSCMVTEVLKSKYGIDIYNLAHSGDQPQDYFNHAEVFIRTRAPDARVVMLFFEGNDFLPFGRVTYRAHRWRPYTQFFQDSNVYRVTHWLYTRTFKPKTYDKPVIGTVAHLTIAFESDYVANVMRERPFTEEEMRFGDLFDGLKGRVEHVFFAPAKYRVYAPLIDGELKPLPNRNWEYLEQVTRSHDIPATNLTPALEEAARSALTRKEFVYWRGDTHWNCAGQAVAASAMADALRRGR